MKQIDLKNFSKKVAVLVNIGEWELFETKNGYILETPNVYYFDFYGNITEKFEYVKGEKVIFSDDVCAKLGIDLLNKENSSIIL